MDFIWIASVTAGVLGVLLVVLVSIAAVVLLPPVRRRLAERASDREAPEAEAEASEANVDRAVADAQPAHGDGAEPAQR